LSFFTAAVPAGSPAATEPQQLLQGKDVVIAFYDAYNKRDLATIHSLIADDISYHDLVYDEPHEGREGVMSWLKKVSWQAAITYHGLQ
jgi:ketosteroid isomerase-like protein